MGAFCCVCWFSTFGIVAIGCIYTDIGLKAGVRTMRLEPTTAEPLFTLAHASRSTLSPVSPPTRNAGRSCFFLCKLVAVSLPTAVTARLVEGLLSPGRGQPVPLCCEGSEQHERWSVLRFLHRCRNDLCAFSRVEMSLLLNRTGTEPASRVCWEDFYG